MKRYFHQLFQDGTGATVSTSWLFGLTMKQNLDDKRMLSAGDYLKVVSEFALSKGIGLDALLENTDVSPQDLVNPPDLVNNLLVSRVGCNLVRHLGNPIAEAAEYGLRMTVATHGALGVAVQYASDLEEGYTILKDFYNTRINFQDISIQREDPYIHVSLINKVEAPNLDVRVQHFFDLATLVSIATSTYQLLDQSRPDGCIVLNVDASEPEQFPKQHLSGIETRFDQPVLEICIPVSWLNVPLNVINPEMVRVALERCRSELKRLAPDDIVAKIEGHLEGAPHEMPSLENLAQALHMSPATLKRRLNEHNLVYQTLKNRVRLKRASAMLAQRTHTVEEIAEALGYSDASNFTKAFKSWTGQTPKQYLIQNASPPSD